MSVEAAAQDRVKYLLTIKRNERSPSSEIAAHHHRNAQIVEAARRNRASSFVIDGEAVLLGVDGISDFNGLHSRRHNDEVQL